MASEPSDFDARSMIERLGGEVKRRKHNAHVFGKRLKPRDTDDGIALQQTIRRVDEALGMVVAP